MSFNTQLADDAATFLADFGESITYTPTGSAAQAVTAIVDRKPERLKQVRGREFPANILDIQVSKADIPTVTERQDTVSLKLRLDDPSNTICRVTKIIQSDPGLWHLEVTA